MPIRITNTLSGKKEEFVPLHPGEVRMYTCGPTVYGLTHIGNARPAVFFDVVRRFFESSEYKVTWVMNFTDVDDKIINRARQERSTSETVAQHFATEYLRDLESLGVCLPDLQPKVTENIPQIIDLIEKLIEKKAAYKVEGGEVFYSVRSFKKYGELSGKRIDDLLSGVRIQADEKKRDPLDFSLWKPQKASDEPAWDSPWGLGRPGWHIECSAMALCYLGETLDIHGGGLDLIHPHHENEVAQAEAATEKPFARYWMHNEMISIDKTKMSKSLGNIFLTRDFLLKYSAETLRCLLLSVHYRSQVEFGPTTIKEIHSALHRFYSAKKKAGLLGAQISDKTAQETTEEKAFKDAGEKFEAGWRDALSDDFNVPKILALVFDYVRCFNAYVDKKGFKITTVALQLCRRFVDELTELSHVLNLFGEDAGVFLETLKSQVLAERGIDPAQIETQVLERQKARAEKDFAKADSIRQALLAQGIDVKDSAAGTEWDVTFSLPPELPVSIPSLTDK